MNIVQIADGLGNQMFQFALYLQLKANMPDTKIDTTIYRYRPSHNGYELARIFGVQASYATAAERDQMADVSKSTWAQFRRNCLHWTLPTSGNLVQEKEEDFRFNPAILTSDNQYLIGWWQSEKYFSSIEQEVRQQFVFRPTLSPRNEAMLQTILAEPISISLHVRRGDYLKRHHTDKGLVCSPQYYERAVQYFKERYAHPHFFIFSDDPEWVEANMHIANATYISGNTGDEAYVDMQLMAACRHHIIANSSFSWWGAWLGTAEDKIVLAPSTWFKGKSRPDIWPDKWIKINVD